VIVLVAVVVMLASLAMLMMMVLMVMIVVMAVGVPMIVMMVLVAMMVVSVVMVVIADMGAALRLEGALHGRGRAALPPRQFGKSRIVLDVESIACDLHKAMLATQVPGEPREAKRILGPHLQKSLRRRLHLHEAAIFQPQGVAVVEGGLHVEIEQDLGSALAFQRRMAAVPRPVIESHRIDDTAGFHGGLADDGGNAGHGFVSSVVGCW
jgi:hypothetical protein